MRFVSSPSETPDPINTEDLRACLSDFPLSIAVRFGSTGTSAEHALSDLDIGVVFDASVDEDRPALLDRIRAALIESTSRDAVDLVDLKSAGPRLAYAALSTGEVLIGDPAEVTALEAKYLVQKLDFDPIKNRWQRALDRRIMEGTFGRP